MCRRCVASHYRHDDRHRGDDNIIVMMMMVMIVVIPVDAAECAYVVATPML